VAVTRNPGVLGIAADHGGFHLKTELMEELRANRHQVVGFGARVLDPEDDYMASSPTAWS
jgi:ribose 5-phosphate isomerase B